MDNYTIAKHFTFLSRLMEVHGLNSFKSKTYSIAAYKIEQLTVELQTLSKEKVFSINGIGDAIGSKIIELNESGKMQALEELILKTPEGILEMMKIKGLGPKKIFIIWKEMEVENVGELLYACHENRLSLMKGFGKKTQQNIIDSITFYQKQQGNYLYAQVEQLAIEIESLLHSIFDTGQIEITGAFARQSETVEELEYVIALPLKSIIDKISTQPEFEIIEDAEEYILYKYNDGIKIKIYTAEKNSFAWICLETSGTQVFNERFNSYIKDAAPEFASVKSQEEIFKKAGLQFIPASLRENAAIINIASGSKLPDLIRTEDIKGIIHCHSSWSDGSNTLEELAKACVLKKYEYLVISDHSKAAYYAQGLSEDKIKAQHALVDELNDAMTPFKIFKSIESDILNDGSLDYGDIILSTFDLVIASVHSNLKMTEEKAMTRLLKAIENPYTTILGHMTGRLLLSRKGYPIDHKKIIDACAAHDVVIEINAHPRRLDMAWQWLEYALSKGILVSIDPDAHAIEEFGNTKYGVLVAQKGMVTAKNNLSSFSLSEFEKFLQNRKTKK
ncbi:MAG: helix-hairpin-helix domain-containing protein [Ginsengibacter sp.]